MSGEHLDKYVRLIKSEKYFPIIVGIHLLFWGIDLSMYSGSFSLVEGESSVQRVVGEIMSSWVVTVFAFNLLMATRARWVERIFGGLDKMYLIHRRSGMIAVALLLLHFAVVPRHPEFSIGKVMGFAAMALIFLGIAFAAAPILKRKLPYHKWVGGHRLMGLFYTVGIAHALFVPTLISKLPIIRIYVFGMALLGVLSWIYRAFLFGIVNRKSTYKVVSAKQHGKDSVSIRMKAEGQGLEFSAGQFAFFSFAEHSAGESHPFTIASAPGDKELRVVVKASGDFTSALVNTVTVGELVSVEGPYGHLSQDQFHLKSQVWIAGGVGITPFLSLARELPEGKKVRLLWSVRSLSEAHFDSELRALADANEDLEYELWVSTERGYLSYESAGGAACFSDADVAICGPTALRDSLYSQLRNAGTKSENIHYEEFSFR